MNAQEAMLAIVSTPCESHTEDRSSCWKHRWVCIREAEGRDDDKAIWIWVNEILLEPSNEAVVVDCCVMPVGRIGDTVSTQLGAAVEFDKIRGDEAGVMFWEVPVVVFD